METEDGGGSVKGLVLMIEDEEDVRVIAELPAEAVTLGRSILWSWTSLSQE